MVEKREERLWDDLAMWLRSGREKATDVEEGKVREDSISEYLISSIRAENGSVNGSNDAWHRTTRV